MANLGTIYIARWLYVYVRMYYALGGTRVSVSVSIYLLVWLFGCLLVCFSACVYV